MSTWMQFRLSADVDSTLFRNVGDRLTNWNCVKYDKTVSWTTYVTIFLTNFSSFLAGRCLIMNMPVPVIACDLLATWPVVFWLSQHQCVIFWLCNFIQIISLSGCLQKHYHLLLSAFYLAEWNNSHSEMALFLFPATICHSEHSVLQSCQVFTRFHYPDGSSIKQYWR